MNFLSLKNYWILKATIEKEDGSTEPFLFEVFTDSIQNEEIIKDRFEKIESAGNEFNKGNMSYYTYLQNICTLFFRNSMESIEVLKKVDKDIFFDFIQNLPNKKKEYISKNTFFAN